MSAVYRKKPAGQAGSKDAGNSRYVGGNSGYTTRLTSHERPAMGNSRDGAKRYGTGTTGTGSTGSYSRNTSGFSRDGNTAGFSRDGNTAGFSRDGGKKKFFNDRKKDFGAQGKPPYKPYNQQKKHNGPPRDTVELGKFDAAKRTYSFGMQKTETGDSALVILQTRNDNGRLRQDTVLVFEDHVEGFIEAINKALIVFREKKGNKEKGEKSE